jgi:tetratricopeptide (TPR) repeat protein
MALRDIAMAQARAGDSAGAGAIATKIRLISDRNRTRDPSQTQPQDLSLATYALVRAAILAEVALAEARTHPIHSVEARKASEDALALIKDRVELRPDLTAVPLAAIGLTMVILGDHTQAQETFDRALDAARRVQNLGSELMAQVAEARWRAGDPAAAKANLHEAFQRIGAVDRGFPQAYNTIALTQLKVGDLEGALQTVRAARNDQGELMLNPDVLRELVIAQAGASGPGVVVAEWFKRTTSPVHRAYILLGAASAAPHVARKPE